MSKSQKKNVDLLIRRVNLATLDPAHGGPEGYGEIENGALAARGGKIVWLGRDKDLPRHLEANEEVEGYACWLTPGLIDCHTHLVWAGSRSQELEMRLSGATYQEIARAGGGINSSVKATREASLEELIVLAEVRLLTLYAEGVTTFEIKSGYGLEQKSELRMLEVAKELGRRYPVRVQKTFLGAHAVPPEFEGKADDYLDLVCRKMLPAAHKKGLVDAVDAFCEGIAFSPEQTRKVFDAAKKLGLPVKLHADQLSDTGGAGLVAEYGGLSADHVEYTSQASVEAMAKAGTVAVLLPGAFYSLRETQKPPIEAFRAAGVPMAVATDCNPGTSPCTSLLLMLHMSCILFGLKPAEALAGVTRNAARALGLQNEIGRLATGLRAELVLWAIDHPRDLACYFGRNPRVRTFV